MVRTIKRQLVKRSLELLKDIAARPSEDPRGDYSKWCFAPYDTAACPVVVRSPSRPNVGQRLFLGAACVGCPAGVASNLISRSARGSCLCCSNAAVGHAWRTFCQGDASQALLQP